MLHVVVANVALRHGTFMRRLREIAAYRKITNVCQASLFADWQSLSTTEFQAVILARIVRCGNHDACGIVELANREIQTIGCGQAKVNGIDALISDATQNSRRYLW